jgi:methylmalonyl-CoA/ethylmalonyl-CoA epimerase
VAGGADDVGHAAEGLIAHLRAATLRTLGLRAPAIGVPSAHVGTTVAAPAAGVRAAAPIGTAAIAVRARLGPIPLFRVLHAHLEPLDALENLIEFALDVPGSIALCLRESGDSEGQNGEGCNSQHDGTVNTDCGDGFRPRAGFSIIGLVKRIDHVGVAVGDLAAARKIWDLVLGQQPECEEVATQKVKTAMYPCGIELVAPATGDSPISKFLAKRGDGIHHVTLEVDDIEAQLARLKAANVRLINETPTPGHGGCRVAFLHPSSTGGVLVELKENP